MKRTTEPPQYKGRRSLAEYQSDRLSFSVEAARECGELWKLERRVYVAASPAACQAVLRRTTYEYTTRPGTFPPLERPRDAPPLERELAHGHAARMRGLRPRAVASQVGLVAQGASAFAAGWPLGQDIAVLPRAERILAEIGNRFLFGAEGAVLLDPVHGLFRARQEVLSQPWPAWMPTPANRNMKTVRTRFSRQLQGIIDRRRTEGDPGHDLLGHMLRPSSQYGLLPDRVIHDSLTGLSVAMMEVPSRAVGWLLLALARNPHMAERIAAEAQSIPFDPEAVTGAHTAGLHYSEAFVREVLRLHPPNWLLMRIATEPTELAGYRVAPGTKMLVCPYTAHRDPGRYSEPDRFRPERWLTESAESPEQTGSAFLPFGTGPRSCEGTALAMLELTLIAAETACRYRLHEPEGPGPSHRIDTNGGLTPLGLRLRATPRR